MGFSCFYGAEKVLNFDSLIWVGTLLGWLITYVDGLPIWRSLSIPVLTSTLRH